MIIFQTQHQYFYNKVIHNLLEVFIFNDKSNVDDEIEKYMPKYLYREQFQKCVKTFNDLFNWTVDKFFHDMLAFHEVALYNFLVYHRDFHKKSIKLNKQVFDDEVEKELDNVIKEELKLDNETNYEELYNYYHDVFNYIDELFIDIDFDFIEYIYNFHSMGIETLEKTLGINLDYYFEILPIDIQNKFPTHHITLEGELIEMISFIQKKAIYGTLNRLFWENNKPINERKIQIILENEFETYFYNKNIDISREVLTGNGQIDFKFFKNKDEKILIEVKIASSSYLKKGYEKQILDYLHASNYKNAFYLIVCFTDEDYKIAANFIKENIYTEHFNLYINISLLDVRKRKTASKK